MTGKRSNSDEDEGQSKRQRREESTPRPVEDGSSTRQQAEEYLLATAKVPVGAMTRRWEGWDNRGLSRRQVARLHQEFRDVGLFREAEENFIVAQCSAAAVKKMLARLGADGREKALDFTDWVTVNGDAKIEVINGQHRMETLRLLHGKGKWWTCSIYDRDKLPPGLRRQLRMNRRGASLPDCPADMWMQLVQAEQEEEGSLFNDDKKATEKRIRSFLRLGSKDSFPVGRVVTLWRNTRWRGMLTRWYGTQLGRETLPNVSTCEWMASLQIDGYWFSPLQATLQTLRELHEEAADAVSRQDWAMMVKELGGEDYEPAAVTRLFYPHKAGQVGERGGRRRRREDFLCGLGDRAYDEVHRRLCSSHRYLFPEVDGVLGIKKEEGQIMRTVMMHVVRWVNAAPDQAKNIRASNKPLHRRGLEPPLRCVYESRADMDERGKQRQAEADALMLEKEILDSARRHMKLLQSPALYTQLEQYPRAGEEDEYAQRFSEEPWREMLTLVKRRLGAEFLPPWREEQISQPRSCALARSMVALLRSIPEVEGNATLRSREALEELCEAIDEPVRRWIRRRQDGDRCARKVERGGPGLLASIEEKGEGTKEAGGRAEGRTVSATRSVEGDTEGYLSSSFEWPETPCSMAADTPAEKQQKGNTTEEQDTTRPPISIGSGGAQRSRATESRGDRERRPVPLSPVRKLQITANTEEKGQEHGIPIQSRKIGGSKQRPRMRKAREELPSIAQLLTGFHGTNQLLGRPKGDKTESW